MTELQKPKPEATELYDFFNVLDYIQEKYKINSYDYLDSEGHIDRWKNHFFEIKKEKLTAEETEYLYKKWFTTKPEHYDAETVIVSNLYKEWLVKNPKPEVLCFWDWLMHHDFLGVCNETKLSINVGGWLKRLPKDDWRHKILKLFYDEYKQEIMCFWVEW